MIRDAQPSDAAELALLYNYYITDSVATFETAPVTANIMKNRVSVLQDLGFPYLVSIKDEVIVGYAYASQWKARAAYQHTVEVSVYISPNHHGKRIASSLYNALFKKLESDDYHAVIGVITLPNEASVKLHESFGMKKVAHFSEVGRKFGNWIDVGYWQGFLE